MNLDFICALLKKSFFLTKIIVAKSIVFKQTDNGWYVISAIAIHKNNTVLII